MVPVIRYRVRTERNQSPGHGSLGLYVIVLSAGSLSGATRADRSPAPANEEVDGTPLSGLDC